MNLVKNQKMKNILLLLLMIFLLFILLSPYGCNLYNIYIMNKKYIDYDPGWKTIFFLSQIRLKIYYTSNSNIEPIKYTKNEYPYYEFRTEYDVNGKKNFIYDTSFFMFDGKKKHYIYITVDENGKVIKEKTTKMLYPLYYHGIIYGFKEYYDDEIMNHNFAKYEFKVD